MKHLILLAAACSALLAGCATATPDGASARRAGPDDTYVPTGSSIARRSIDRASPVKTANKEELENARLMGGDNLNSQRN
jgi:hypothetical protein